MLPEIFSEKIGKLHEGRIIFGVCRIFVTSVLVVVLTAPSRGGHGGEKWSAFLTGGRDCFGTNYATSDERKKGSLARISIDIAKTLKATCHFIYLSQLIKANIDQSALLYIIRCGIGGRRNLDSKGRENFGGLCAALRDDRTPAPDFGTVSFADFCFSGKSLSFSAALSVNG
jgi:hypothetical protein